MVNLFDDTELPPHQRHSATSRAAALEVEPKADTWRRIVLDALRKRGSDGGTDEELQLDTGLGGNTERPRRIELLKAGLIRDSGLTRKTASGRQAVVWIAA